MTTQRCDRFCTKHHSTQSKRITCNSSESAPIKIRVYNCLFILDCEIPSLEGHYYYNAPCCQCVIFLSTHTCPKLTYWISETITYMDFETQFRWSVFTLIFRNLNWIITPKNSTKPQKINDQLESSGLSRWCARCPYFLARLCIWTYFFCSSGKCWMTDSNSICRNSLSIMRFDVFPWIRELFWILNLSGIRNKTCLISQKQ